LVGFVTSATVLSFGSGPPTFLALRKELPAQERPFRLGGGVIIPYLAFLSSNLIVFWSGWGVVWKLMLAVVLGFFILFLHELFARHETPRLDFRSGAWVLPWLGGLCLISWLGTYPRVYLPGTPKAAHNVGNVGVLGPDLAILVLAVFSVLILWLAHVSRLPKERVETYVAEGREEAATEADAMHAMEV
jgi:amino acid transporter